MKTKESKKIKKKVKVPRSINGWAVTNRHGDVIDVHLDKSNAINQAFFVDGKYYAATIRLIGRSL